MIRDLAEKGLCLVEDKLEAVTPLVRWPPDLP